MMEKFELKQILKNGVITVVFTKVDGTERELKCTLNSDFLPESNKQLLVEGSTKKENDNVLSVWDIDNQGWRSFRLDSIKEVRN